MKYEPLPEPNRLNVVELGPDDILVLRCPSSMSGEAAEWLRSEMEARFPGRRCLVLGDGITLDVLRETEVKP
jgi:hypothetical protein